MTDELIVNIILIAFIAFTVFAIIREIVCWYWKINKGILLQEKILAELVKLNNNPVEYHKKIKIKTNFNDDNISVKMKDSTINI